MSVTEPAAPSAGVRGRLWIACALLFAVALGVRLLYLQQLSETPFQDDTKLIADARYYQMRAGEIAAGRIWNDLPGFLSPGYCLFLGGVFVLFGADVASTQVAQALLGSLSVVLLYLVARRLFPEWIGLLSGGILALYSTHVYYTGVRLPAILVLFLHLLLLWVLGDARRGWRLALGGGIVGLAILTKANALLLLPALSAWIWLASPAREWRPRLTRIALFCGVAALTVAPTTLHNYRVSDSLLLVTTTGGANLLKGNGPTATGSHAFLPLGAQATGVAAHLAGRVDPVASAAQSRELSAQAARYMLDHPSRALALFGKKLLLLFSAYEWGIRDQFHFVARLVPILRWALLPFWAVVPLGLVGAAVAVGEWRRFGALQAVILAQIASFVLIFVLARYRLVLVACLLPFAGWLLQRLVDWARARRLRPLVGAGVGLLVLFTVGGLRYDEPSRGQGFADQWYFVGRVLAAEGELERAADAFESASKAVWIDPRSATESRWRALVAEAATRIELGQVASATEALDRLDREIGRAYPLGHPLDERIGQLRQRARMLR
jgi:4-amino-4-deoxy-L-arabinose transferase-like glycosyltransferase